MKKAALALLGCLILLANCALADRGAPEIILESQPKQACTAVIRCAGDFVIHDNLLASAQKAGGGKYAFAQMMEEIGEYMGEADFIFTNVDGVMGTEEFGRKYGYKGYPSFSTPSSLIYDLKDIGVDLLTLANNHAIDYWYDGLISTVTSVKNAGLYSVGGYRSLTEKQTPCIVDVNGIAIGFLNYTDGLNQMDKRRALDKAALEYGVDFLEYANVPADIQRLQDAGAELIVCYMHWGIEYRKEPCNSQKSNAAMLAKAGVDVIIGGGPHMVQRAEYITTTDAAGKPKKVLCLYSLGNFLSDQRGEGKDCGIIFDFTVTRDEDGVVTVSDPCYRTTWVWRRQSGSTFAYSILFSDNVTARPDRMSEKDYNRMLESARETYDRMKQGCAKLAVAKEETEAIIAAPSRR